MQPRPMRAKEAFGCGCAAFDADNDGWQDVLVAAVPHPIFFHNVEGVFKNETAASGFGQIKGDWTGCAVADYDDDGLLDVLLTGFHCLSLCKNAGGLSFRDATEQAGLDPSNHNHWGSSAGFMDLDNDNLLDLVVLNLVEFGPDVRQYCELKPGVLIGCRPREYVPEKGEIWQNTGQGRFKIVPAENGMASTHGLGLVVAFSDINLDGKLDFYIGNDGYPSEMLLNLGGMKFENIGESSGLAYDGRGQSPASMGGDWGDYDRDGKMDLTISNFQDAGFVVYHNQGGNQFWDASVPTGLAEATRNRLGFGTKWVDFDNDGWVDIFFVNGHVYDRVAEAVGASVQFRQPLNLFHNQRGEAFVDVAPQMDNKVLRPMVGRGSAAIDFDNDGRVDLLGLDFEGPLMLLHNRSKVDNHWITLDLRGKAPNRFAHGARLAAKTGNQTWIAEVSPASSYLSSSDPRIHWGLGDATEIEELTIRWPSGKTEVLKNIKADQILQVNQSP
ncbi:MAG: CRTAC1 family protein [Pirellulaceae bacterium]